VDLCDKKFVKQMLEYASKMGFIPLKKVRHFE